MLLCGGCPALLRPLTMRWVILLPGQGILLRPLAAHGKGLLMSGGSLSFHLLVGARVKPALLAGGCLLLFPVLWLAAREEHASYFVPLSLSPSRLCPLSMCCPWVCPRSPGDLGRLG